MKDKGTSSVAGGGDVHTFVFAQRGHVVSSMVQYWYDVIFLQGGGTLKNVALLLAEDGKTGNPHRASVVASGLEGRGICCSRDHV